MNEEKEYMKLLINLLEKIFQFQSRKELIILQN